MHTYKDISVIATTVELFVHDSDARMIRFYVIVLEKVVTSITPHMLHTFYIHRNHG